jgi:hypothetical protein
VIREPMTRTTFITSQKATVDAGERTSEAGRYLAATAAILVLATLLRLSFVLSNDFPLYDGGLFYSMVLDLEKAHFALPTQTSYNSAGLPFAYPPLAFYVAAALHSAFGISLFEIFRLMPLVANVLAIAAFAWLARSMLSNFTAFVVALLTFALLPEGFRFFIAGGGLTRSVGLLLAILAIWAAHRLCTLRRPVYIPVLMVFLASVVLSHPEMALFSAYTVGLIAVFYGRNRKVFLWLLVSIAGAAILILPWLGSVISHQGYTPFVNAMARGGGLDIRSLLFFNVTGETGFPFLGALALIGMIVCLTKKQYFLPVWVLAILILQSRDPRQEDVVPIALLAGIGAAEGLLPLARGALSGFIAVEESRAHRLVNRALVLMFISVLLADLVSYRPLLTGLSSQEREAMGWIQTNTNTTSRFLIVTGTRGGDRSFEWFPALTNRINAAPIEGYEWVPGFQKRVQNDIDLQMCASQGVECLNSWSQKTETEFDYIYVPKRPAAPLFAASTDLLQKKDCCWSIRAALQGSSRFEVAYESEGATIFRMLDP